VFEKCGKLYIRFYQNTRKVTEFLCVVDGDHYRAKTRKGFQLSPAVDSLRAARMVAVNAAIAPAQETLIPDFWTNVYLKWAESEGLAQSTVLGYQKIWNSHLSAEFAGKTLAGYSTADGYAFLMWLRTEKNLGRHALAHVRNAASGIFTHAVTLGKIAVNPWHGLKQPRTPKPADTHAYSEGEAIAILNAISRPDAKLLFALCAFEGLRPSEAAGLDWSQVGREYLTVKSAVVSGVATGRLKNEGTQRDLLIIEPVKSLLIEWRAKCGGVTAGLLFTGRGGNPINSSSFAKHTIISDVQAAGLTWHGLYAGRRGCATRINELCGINAAFATLGNSYQVTAAKYVKPQQAASDAGLRSVSTGANHAAP
jgi:integrase